MVIKIFFIFNNICIIEKQPANYKRSSASGSMFKTVGHFHEFCKVGHPDVRRQLVDFDIHFQTAFSVCLDRFAKKLKMTGTGWNIVIGSWHTAFRDRLKPVIDDDIGFTRQQTVDMDFYMVSVIPGLYHGIAPGIDPFGGLDSELIA